MKSTATKFGFLEQLSKISRTELSEILLSIFDGAVAYFTAPEPVEGWMLVKRIHNEATDTTDMQEVMFFYDYRAAVETLKKRVAQSDHYDVYWDLKAGVLVDTPEEPTQEEPARPVSETTPEDLEKTKARWANLEEERNKMAARASAYFEKERGDYEAFVLSVGRVLTPEENSEWHQKRREAAALEQEKSSVQYKIEAKAVSLGRPLTFEERQEIIEAGVTQNHPA